jgi:hypothetical protein
LHCTLKLRIPTLAYPSEKLIGGITVAQIALATRLFKENENPNREQVIQAFNSGPQWISFASKNSGISERKIKYELYDTFLKNDCIIESIDCWLQAKTHEFNVMLDPMALDTQRRLQECTQALGIEFPQYFFYPMSKKLFKSTCVVFLSKDNVLKTRARGKSKKLASAEAAKNMLIQYSEQLNKR